ncbi:MAG TPA: hypothetical protein VIQ77_05850 [Mucilaginibacter sp.]|jgi:hypothetical protein
MKHIYTLFLFCSLILVFQSCGQLPTGNLPADHRPKDELAFVKLLDTAYWNTSNQTNDIGKKDAANNNKIKITHFIIDTLKTNFKNWQVTVFKIEDAILEGGVNVELLVSKKAQPDEKNPEFESIILKAHVADDDSIKNKFKLLQAGDRILLTGSFAIDKDEQGNIQFSPYMSGSLRIEDQFSEPVFNFVTTDVKIPKPINRTK